jgi:hypothetical protein
MSVLSSIESTTFCDIFNLILVTMKMGSVAVVE